MIGKQGKIVKGKTNEEINFGTQDFGEELRSLFKTNKFFSRPATLAGNTNVKFIPMGTILGVIQSETNTK